MSRALRRFQLEIKIANRSKFWGKTEHWMKSTGTPCSCFICQGFDKYKRVQSKTTNYYLDQD